MPKPITEQKAKRQLAKMLQSFTPGSILNLLADHLAEESDQLTESKTSDQIQLVCHALIVVGTGIDAVLPS